MYRQGFVIFFLAIGPAFLCYGKVEMADNPILEYLHLDPKSVIEHELIDIDLSNNIHKRSTNNKFDGVHMRTRAFGQDINKWLYPRDSLLASNETPVYFGHRDDNQRARVVYEIQPGVMARVGRLFEDAEHYASVVIGTDPQTNEAAVTADIPLRGDIAAIMIRPLPAHVVEEHLRKRRSIGEIDDSSLNLKRHVAVKINDYRSDIFRGERSEKVNLRGDSIGPIVEIPGDDPLPIDYSNSIYPKLFLQYDNTFFKYSFWDPASDDLLRFLEYVLAFWNGVDLSYRHLENPGIRLHIAGIAIATQSAATPYIENNYLRIYDSSSRTQKYRLLADGAIEESRKFFYNVGEQIRIGTYDVVLTMTKYTMDGRTLGIALTTGACGVNPIDRRFDGVALVTDNGVFNGIHTAAHELGHSLGLSHDNVTVNMECDENYGYIMAPSTNPTENSARFSRCSLDNFDSILRRGSLRCMYEPPQMKLNLPKLMPGKIATLDEQCLPYGAAGACFNPTRDVCIVLTCRYTDSLYDRRNYGNSCLKLGHSAAPGSPCGNGPDGKPRFCLEKQCVSLD